MRQQANNSSERKNSMMTSLRAAMATQPVFGTFIKLGRREVVEILSHAGFDFGICDLEHSQITEAEASTVILAGAACRFPIIVRVPSLDVGLVNRLLEAGAAGIQLPQIQRRAQVTAFCSAVRYPPQGSRSISLGQPAANYGSEPVGDYIRRANEEILLVGQLETKEIEQPMAELIRSLDVAFVGILDMSVDMGTPGKLDDSAIVQRVREIEAAATAAKIPMGIYADSPERACQASAAGYRYIALSSDLGGLSTSVKGWVKQLRESSPGKA
jgi:2-keto-3-deoxy-L-rhamnonate aldolase RhmA